MLAACLPEAPVAVVDPALLDLLTTGTLLADTRGRVTYANPAARRLLGGGRVHGRHLSELLVGDDPGLLEPDLERVLRDRCTLQRFFVREIDGVSHRIGVCVDALGPRGADVTVVVQLDDRGDVVDDPVLRNLLADLAHDDDPSVVTLLLDRSLRCVAASGGGGRAMGIDTVALTGRHVGVGVPEPLRGSILARCAQALAGTMSHAEVVSPDDGRLFHLEVLPLRESTRVGGVVVTGRVPGGQRSVRTPPADEPGHVLRVGRVAVDLLTRLVTVDGRENIRRLTGREFELLRDLMRHQGVVRTREELLAAVWGVDFPTSTSVVDVTMHRLRTKLQLEELGTVRAGGLVFAST